MREQRARRAEAEVRRELTPLRVAVGSALEENREHGAGRLVEQRHRARLLKAQARLNPYLAALDELSRGIGAGRPLDQWRGML